jgi:uncharacterized membrane protein YhfC
MASALGIAGIAVAMLLSLGGPILIYLICRHRMTLSWRNILVGLAVFVVFALVLEQVMHYIVLQVNPTTVAWISSSPWNYVIYAVLAAALFEEIGRYAGMRLFVKPHGNPGTGVAYGLGHGGIEAFLVGALSQLQFLMLGVALNQGRYDAVTAALPPAQAGALRNLLETLTFGDALYGGIERLVALLAQIFFSLIVWKAVAERKIVFLAVAILAHIVFDIPAGMYQAGMIPLWQVQVAMIAVGIVLLAYFVMRLPKRMDGARPAPA